MQYSKIVLALFLAASASGATIPLSSRAKNANKAADAAVANTANACGAVAQTGNAQADAGSKKAGAANVGNAADAGAADFVNANAGNKKAGNANVGNANAGAADAGAAVAGVADVGNANANAGNKKAGNANVGNANANAGNNNAGAADAGANAGGAAVGGGGGAADFGTCSPAIDFQLGRAGRKADEGTFLPSDPVVAQGQQDALNPNIITNRVCDQLSNVCGANAAAITLCESAQATVAALGTKDATTAAAFNAALGV